MVVGSNRCYFTSQGFLGFFRRRIFRCSLHVSTVSFSRHDIRLHTCIFPFLLFGQQYNKALLFDFQQWSENEANLVEPIFIRKFQWTREDIDIALHLRRALPLLLKLREIFRYLLWGASFSHHDIQLRLVFLGLVTKCDLVPVPVSSAYIRFRDRIAVQIESPKPVMGVIILKSQNFSIYKTTWVLCAVLCMSVFCQISMSKLPQSIKTSSSGQVLERVLEKQAEVLDLILSQDKYANFTSAAGRRQCLAMDICNWVLNIWFFYLFRMVHSVII